MNDSTVLQDYHIYLHRFCATEQKQHHLRRVMIEPHPANVVFFAARGDRIRPRRAEALCWMILTFERSFILVYSSGGGRNCSLLFLLIDFYFCANLSSWSQSSICTQMTCSVMCTEREVLSSLPKHGGRGISPYVPSPETACDALLIFVCGRETGVPHVALAIGA